MNTLLPKMPQKVLMDSVAFMLACDICHNCFGFLPVVSSSIEFHYCSTDFMLIFRQGKRCVCCTRVAMSLKSPTNLFPTRLATMPVSTTVCGVCLESLAHWPSSEDNWVTPNLSLTSLRRGHDFHSDCINYCLARSKVVLTGRASMSTHENRRDGKGLYAGAGRDNRSARRLLVENKVHLS